MPRNPSTMCRIHFLDVGPLEYADAILCEFGERRVLIDGAHPGDNLAREGHPSIPDQLGDLLGQQPPFEMDLLIVSHAHQDHIGCLPKLVKDGLVSFRWALVADPDLGWGRAQDEDRDSEIRDARVRQVVEALRDECAPHDPRTSDQRLSEFLDAAAKLEATYRQMLTTLQDRGTRVVRVGQDNPQPLEGDLEDIGLKVIGPSQQQLDLCADLINRTMRDAISHTSDVFSRDDTQTSLDIYRRLVRRNIDAAGLDALDASRPGPAVNLQSVVTVFEFEQQRFLFAGDMQFADPQVSNTQLEESVRSLRRRVSQHTPYDVAKLSHHGSNNAFSEDILSELQGTVLFGICAGSGSTRHPNPATLRVLNRHRDDIQWARTDRNGQVTMTFTRGAAPEIELSKGRLNDPRPNSTDEMSSLLPLEASTPRITVEPPRPLGQRSPDVVEVRAFIPHVSTKVTLTVEVSPARERQPGRGSIPSRTGGQPADRFVLAGGRELPRLLFVTQGQKLAQNVGAGEGEAALEAIRARRHVICDDTPLGASEIADVVNVVRETLSLNPDVEGVVILGGPDVVPLQSLDCLPRDLRERIGDNDDPDHFVVWSDAIYGDRDGDGLPELPVSRIPDGKSAALMHAALGATRSSRQKRSGVRNIERPFAEDIFSSLPGRQALLVSHPTVFDQDPTINLDGDHLYLMLHGDYVDATRYWGEGTPNNREAVNVNNLPPRMDGVIFTGCCWGALTTDTPAGLVQRGRPFGLKTPESSIALAALARGALAFIGCTGAHYSPSEEPYNYFGGPMHRAFWRHLTNAVPPAKALFQAKVDYLAGMPHGRQTAMQLAIEFKILRQYTCLGLGW